MTISCDIILLPFCKGVARYQGYRMTSFECIREYNYYLTNRSRMNDLVMYLQMVQFS